MFSDPITLDVTGADDPIFTKTGAGPSFSNWVDNDPPAGVRREMYIKHSKVGKVNAVGGIVQRHLVQIKHLQYNSTLGKDEVMTVNFTVTLPSAHSISAANKLIIYEAIVKMINTAGYTDKLERNEI